MSINFDLEFVREPTRVVDRELTVGRRNVRATDIARRDSIRDQYLGAFGRLPPAVNDWVGIRPILGEHQVPVNDGEAIDTIPKPHVIDSSVAISHDYARQF